MTKIRKEVKEKLRSSTKNSRNLIHSIYISCEGKTEKSYLRGVKKKYKDVATLNISSHKTKVTALDVVKNLENKYKYKYDKNDLKFCIFDCDSNSPNDLRVAKQKADKIGAKIIFSNPCFEIWLYWHFKDENGHITAKNLKDYIKKELNEDYCSNEFLYDILINKEPRAINNANVRKYNLAEQEISPYSTESNPSTDMNKLLEYLDSLKTRHS